MDIYDLWIKEYIEQIRETFERHVKKLKTIHMATRIPQTARDCHKEQFCSNPSFQATQAEKLEKGL